MLSWAGAALCAIAVVVATALVLYGRPVPQLAGPVRRLLVTHVLVLAVCAVAVAVPGVQRSAATQTTHSAEHR